MTYVALICLFMSNLLTALSAIGLKRDFQQSMGYGQFILHNNSYLNVPKLRLENITDRQDCAISCVISPKCLSYNVASTTTNGKYLCEILNTDKYRNSSNLTPNANFHHYSVWSPCISSPCKNRATCIPNYSNSSYKCACAEGLGGSHCQTARDCAALYKSGQRQSGVYTVDPDGKGTVNVYCDMVTDGGGWTVIQRRKDGSVDFYRDWASYKHGFGSLSGEFWLGNDNIHRLTSSGITMLRIELEDWSGNAAYAKYGRFGVADESNQYNLTVRSYSGTAGDSLSWHNGMRFSTKDRENDQNPSDHCARSYTGAWWYNSCHHSNLNGRYLGNVQSTQGIRWHKWRLTTQCMKFAQMKIRRLSLGA